MSISKEAIEAAARAWAIHDEIDGCFERVDEWEALEDWEREAHPDEYPGSDYEDCGDYRERATAALTAAAPYIQAAALREFAHALTAMITVYAERTTEYDAGWVAGMTSAISGLTARADQLEGESE